MQGTCLSREGSHCRLGVLLARIEIDHPERPVPSRSSASSKVGWSWGKGGSHAKLKAQRSVLRAVYHFSDQGVSREKPCDSARRSTYLIDRLTPATCSPQA